MDFNTGDIIKFIKALDPNKAHGYDGIPIHMYKLYAFSISKPLDILFKNCLEKECFPKEWKDALPSEIMFLFIRKEISN